MTPHDLSTSDSHDSRNPSARVKALLELGNIDSYAMDHATTLSNVIRTTDIDSVNQTSLERIKELINQVKDAYDDLYGAAQLTSNIEFQKRARSHGLNLKAILDVAQQFVSAAELTIEARHQEAKLAHINQEPIRDKLITGYARSCSSVDDMDYKKLFFNTTSDANVEESPSQFHLSRQDKQEITIIFSIMSAVITAAITLMVVSDDAYSYIGGSFTLIGAIGVALYTLNKHLSIFSHTMREIPSKSNYSIKYMKDLMYEFDHASAGRTFYDAMKIITYGESHYQQDLKKKAKDENADIELPYLTHIDDHDIAATKQWILETMPLIRIACPTGSTGIARVDRRCFSTKEQEALELAFRRYEQLLVNPEKAQRIAREKIEETQIAQRTAQSKENALDDYIATYGD